jgi:ankyrin repeat protein
MPYTDFGLALHKCVEGGHLDIVDVLLEAGADASLKDGRGRTAADLAIEKRLRGELLQKLAAPISSKA